jgi:dTDP-4-amino-4,6-dideoxygalactose transaminase
MKREAKKLLEEHTIAVELASTIASGRYLFGNKAEELEKVLSERFNGEAVLVGSCTDALYLSLKAINAKHQVIVPAVSAIPTAVAVKMAGLEPVYVDVESNTRTICPIQLEKTLEENPLVSAVIVVHLYGNWAHMYAIKSICDAKNIPIIEDCAQSFGGGMYESASGLMSAHSFYPTKNLGCMGDGGAVITKDTSLAAQLKELRFYGQKSSYVMGHTHGINSRMDELQCTILLEKMKYIDEIEAKRRHMLRRYNEYLKPVVNTLEWDMSAMPHLYPIFVNDRIAFRKKMDSAGIQTAIHYPFTLPAAVSKDYGSYPAAEYCSQEEVSIPFNPWMTEEEIEYVLLNTLKIIKEGY